MTTVKAAITQCTWTGAKESMIEKHVGYLEQAAGQGVQVICFQELFFGPYFGVVQQRKYYDYAESIPGPTSDKFCELAKQHHMVVILPIYEEEMPGVYYNTAVVIDADGSIVGKYRKSHLPHLPYFWEKFYFRPGNTGFKVWDTAVGKVGVCICYDRHFPESWRCLGLAGAQMVFNPNASAPGLSNRLWELEQNAAAGDNGYFVLVPNRVGAETGEFGEDAVDFYGSSFVADPRGNYVGEVGSTTEEEMLVRDLDLDLLVATRKDWQFYRDRRPDLYEPILRP
jgi:N-carbamoylputrescine amidase